MTVLKDGHLPLPTLLSHALVAFTIEFDNEFEHQTPHRTTDFGSTLGAPWLVSMVMWSKFLRHVPEEGITVRELRLRTRSSEKVMQNWLTRLSQWWGYVVVEQAKTAGPSRRIQADALVRPTAGGKKALAVWQPLTGVIEERWEKRFGCEALDRLRAGLSGITRQLDPGLPDSLPILGYGLFSKEAEGEKAAPVSVDDEKPSLPGLLSRVLLAFATEFEGESPVSLAIAANVLRLAGTEGVRVKNLPRRAGVSPEAISMAVKFLQSQSYAVVEPEAAGRRVKLLRLTPKGSQAQQSYHELVWAIEERWSGRFGSGQVRSLREVLERLTGEPGPLSLLMSGLKPYPDCWRASVLAPETLPHFPMVLHRGGFPDGS